MIWQISHIIAEILNSIREIQDAISEDQVKQNAELVIPDCVQSEISPPIAAIQQISHDYWATAAGGGNRPLSHRSGQIGVIRKQLTLNHFDLSVNHVVRIHLGAPN